MKYKPQSLWGRVAALTLLFAVVVPPVAAQAEADQGTATVQVEVDSPADAQEAAVLVNGKTIGPIPLSLTLQPGRYLIEVSRPGRRTWRRWLDVNAGDQTVLRAKLMPVASTKPDKPKLGILLVGCDLLDAEVLVDGKSVGTVPVLLERVEPGEHLVSVRTAGRQQERRVVVRAGETTKLSVALADSKPAAGVASASTGGESAAAERPSEKQSEAKTPAAKPEVAAAAPPQRTAATAAAAAAAPAAEAGQGTAPAAPIETARLLVASQPIGADIFVDGVFRGVAPLAVEELASGAHQVEARALGMLPAQQTVTLEAGATLKLKLRLETEPRAREGELVVTTATPGAVVYVDGDRLGETPLRRRVLVGPHVVRVRRKGSEEHMTTADVRAEEPVELHLVLKASPRAADGSPQAPAAEPSAELASDTSYQSWTSSATDLGLRGTHSAQLVQPSRVMADFSTGFPYLAEVRVTAGLADFGWIGVDAGLDMRTYGAVTELGVRGRARLLARGPWSLAASVSLGGGGGPRGRDTFFMEAGGVASVLVMNRVNLSLSGAINLYSDRHCPATAGPNDLAVCSRPPAGVSLQDARERFNGARFIFGAVAELPLTSWLNVFGALEFAPFQGNRRAFSDSFASIMPESDPGIYGRIGMTVKR